MTTPQNKEIKLFKIESVRFSIEIEVEFPNTEKSEKIIKRNSIIKGWCIDHDGSLDSGAEFRPRSRHKLYYNEDCLTEIKEVLALIKVHRGKAKETCGLHCHVDCSKLTDQQVLTCLKEWIHKQKRIIKRFKVSPKRLDQYCQLLPKENLSKLTIKEIHKFRTGTKEWNFDGYSFLDSKYYSLNATHLAKGDYGTLEFRLFSATLNFKKMKECILFCLNFIKDSVERE